MKELITIIKSNISFTPYTFYTGFLIDVANAFIAKKPELKFKLFENGDNNIYDSNYRIDPISIPLLLSLLEQLQKHYHHEIELFLYNNSATKKVLEFLNSSDFFHIGGDNRNPSFPLGRNIFTYDRNYLGAFEGKDQRIDHKVRAYSLDDDNLRMMLKDLENEEQIRNFLLSHFSYKVREHFEELLFDNEHTISLHNIYIDLLSELITNGVMHSKSNTFAYMFVNRFSTKFSISDNGIGLENSMLTKQSTFYYQPQSLKDILLTQNRLKNISKGILNNLYFIFETLYYSSLRDRKGLFDLMINVVLSSKGYFRIHTENCQVIISNRMMDDLIKLKNLRAEIFEIQSKHLLKLLNETTYERNMLKLAKQIKDCFVLFYNLAVNRYNDDIKYSSLRFFKVKFRGVHIEIEIPNA